MNSLKDVLDAHSSNSMRNMHTALPAVITSFNASVQTVTVQVTLQRIIAGLAVTIAPLVDVPVVQMTGGGYHITIPIIAGDECLVVFSERAIDNWFDRGGVQAPIELRIHDISDGFAIIGVNSKPNAISDYNTDGLVIRNDANDQKITLNSDGSIDIDTTGDINLTSPTKIMMTTPLVEMSDDLIVNGIDFLTHFHDQENDSRGDSEMPTEIARN